MTLHVAEPLIVYFVVAMLLVRNLFAQPLLLYVLKFPNTYATSSAASGVVAYLHAVPVCVACLGLVMKFPLLGSLGGSTRDFPDEWNAAALVCIKYTSAYMIQDLFMMLVDEFRYVNDEPYFVSFLLHHTGCLLYLSLVRYYSAGHYSVLLLILIGEMTNPVQNAVNFCLQGVKGGKVWCSTALVYLNPIFGFYFAIVRLLIAPVLALIFVYELLYQKYTGELTTDIPLPVGALWCVLFIATIHGSYPFAIEKLKAGGWIGGGEEKKMSEKKE